MQPIRVRSMAAVAVGRRVVLALAAQEARELEEPGTMALVGLEGPQTPLDQTALNMDLVMDQAVAVGRDKGLVGVPVLASVFRAVCMERVLEVP